MTLYKHFRKFFVPIVALITVGSVSAETNSITAKLNSAPIDSVTQTISELSGMNLVILGDPSRQVDLNLENESHASAIAKLAVQLKARITRYPHTVILSDDETAGRLKQLEQALDDENLVSMTLREAPLRELIEVLDKLTGERNSAALSDQALSVFEHAPPLSLRLLEVPASEVKAILTAYYGVDLIRSNTQTSPPGEEKSSSRRDRTKVPQSKTVLESDSR